MGGKSGDFGWDCARTSAAKRSHASGEVYAGESGDQCADVIVKGHTLRMLVNVMVSPMESNNPSNPAWASQGERLMNALQ